MSSVGYILVFITVLVALAAVIWQYSLDEPDLELGVPCSEAGFPHSQVPNWNAGSIQFQNISLQCFFSSDYFAARDLFRQSASLLNAEMQSLPVVDDLTTDVAILRGNQKKFLFHISGTHGPESFAGSASQSLILQYLASHPDVYLSQAEADRPTIVFIHALNPYGFVKHRRVNEDNVDLNRNFLTPEKFEMVKKRDPNYANYVDMDDVLNPKHAPLKYSLLNDMQSFATAIFGVLKYGATPVKKALVSGNYHTANGMGFGGFDLTKSAKTLLSVMDTLHVSELAEEVVLVDVHTGLGKSGVDTIMLDLNGYKEEGVASIRSQFKVEVDPVNGKVTGSVLEVKSDSNNSASSGYELTIGTTCTFVNELLAKHLPPSKKLTVVQEFGTVPLLRVVMALINENQAFFYGTEEQKQFYSQRVLDCFLIQTNRWKHNVARRALQVFLSSLKLSLD